VRYSSPEKCLQLGTDRTLDKPILPGQRHFFHANERPGLIPDESPRLAKGRYDQALADFDRAIELGAADAWVFMGRGNTYVAMGRYDQALADYGRAIGRAIELGAVATSTSPAGVFIGRGTTYQAMGRYDQALADFTRAIELGAAEAWVFASRGLTYRKMERYDDALADFDRAIELDPTEDEFAAARTEICQLTGRSDTDDAEPANYSETLTDPDRATAATPSSAELAAHARGELNAHPAEPLCRIDTDGWDLSVSWHPDGRSIAVATASAQTRGL
jgi:tetratricopeptide (TPR) repeat protein